MKSAFFSIIFAVFFVLSPLMAMTEDTQEETSKFTQTKLSQQRTSQEKPISVISHIEVTTFAVFPDDILLSVCRFLNVDSLGRVAQVSTRWKKITETPDLWKFMGAKYYGNYLSKEGLKENPKQKVTAHYLSVIVNATGDLKQIESLVNHHRLYLYVPHFKRYIETNFLTDLVTNFSDYEELVAQSNKEVIERKLNGLLEGKYGYVKDLTAARELNELLVERGNPKAIEIKLESLTLSGVKVWVTLASKGYQFPASDVRYVYEIVPLYGDVKDLTAAKELNELLVERGDPEAIKRRISGLAEGEYGYVKNQVAARELNELLIERGNPEAIERKIYGLVHGANGYERNLKAATEFNDLFVERGDLEAIARKMIGLECEEYGYKQDLVTARKLNDLLVERGNLKAIKSKLTRLVSRYKADPKAAEFIESLIVCEFPIVRGIGKYIKAFAMKYGISQLGYEKDRKMAIKFIKENHVPY